ncbi:hypothetical protein NT6N_15290 [Oceaniferula spumae]|uniref:PEP-CTERM protein-sorting domain-containing protein n=1 Tax=Oceaniferula spumae TaxID=2979115 RepID=A0AAT9FKD4_9BACT
MKKILISNLALAASLGFAHATTFVLMPEIFVNVSDDGSATSAGTVDSGSLTGTYLTRTRSNESQNGLQISSFIKFNEQSLGLTPAQYNEASFSATVNVTFASKLNSTNGSQTQLGAVVDGDWDTSGTSFPLYDWGQPDADNPTTASGSTNLGQFTGVIAGVVGTTYSVDVTDEVRAWLDGSDPTDYGFSIYNFNGPNNGAGYNNANLTITAIPEPSSAALLSFAGLGLVFRRRR